MRGTNLINPSTCKESHVQDIEKFKAAWAKTGALRYNTPFSPKQGWIRDKIVADGWAGAESKNRARFESIWDRQTDRHGKV